MIDFVIPAAGSSKRMGTGKNKLLLELKGKEIIFYTLRNLYGLKYLNRIILAVKNEEREHFQNKLEEWGFQNKIHFVEGGKERADSVRNALSFLQENKPAQVIMVHDAARPFYSPSLIEELFNETKKKGAAIPVLPMEDTIRQKQGDEIKVIDREKLMRTQTPQSFLSKYLSIFLNDNNTHTDDIAYLENQGIIPGLVKGEKWNFKVTTQEDLELAKLLIHQQTAL